MKLIYLIQGTYNAGGMERVLSNKANYLVMHGYDVNIVTTDQQERESFFFFSPNINHYDLGINYTKNNSRSILNKSYHYILKKWRHRKVLANLLGVLKADIVISLCDHEASFLWKIEDGSKKVLEIHFSRFKRLQYGRTGLWKWVDQWRNKNDFNMATKYDRFVVLTEEDRSYWGDLPNIMVIPNANSFASTLKADLFRKNAIAIGRYEYQKGFTDLIRCWYEVNKVHPEWVLSIFGEGSLEKELKQLIKELDLESVVHLCKPVRDLKKQYLQSSMLLMTSRYEGLPMALLEGQVCGLPLISYACKCGPKDIIHQDKNGFLIEEGNMSLFAQSVIELIEDPNKRMRMGLESAFLSERFSEKNIMLKWFELFQRLINN